MKRLRPILNLIDWLRRHRKVGYLLLMSLVLSVTLWLYHDARLFPIQVVKIYGELPIGSKPTIKSIINKVGHKSFFALDIQQLQHQLDQLAWLKSVTVRRVWPNTLIIHCQMYQPIAIWNGSALLMSNLSIYIAKGMVVPANLPRFTAKQNQVKVVYQMFQKMNDILAAIGLNISEVALNNDYEWQVTLSNGVVLLLDRDHALDEMKRLARVYPKVFQSKHVPPKQIDMRYQHGMAVKWT